MEQIYLDNAKFVIENLGDPVELVGADNVLSVIGSDPKSTSQAVTVRRRDGEPCGYDFEESMRYGLGDGTVPTVSSVLHGSSYVWLIKEILPSFGLTGYIRLHTALPAIDEVHIITSRFLNGKRGTEILPRNLHASRLVDVKAPED